MHFQYGAKTFLYTFLIAYFPNADFVKIKKKPKSITANKLNELKDFNNAMNKFWLG